MSRTKGAKNIVPFEQRNLVQSSPNAQIKHLAAGPQQTVLESFVDLLNHQTNYINWILSRHEELQKAKASAKRGGPKDATFNKYKWYAEHLLLLEAINAFEVFFKRTVVQLGAAIAAYVPADRVKGSIDARILWTAPSSSTASDLIFESRLYHDLDVIDQATDSLVQAKRYNKNSPQAAMRTTVRSLQAIFQIRHTLSHNHGLLTASDAGKLRLLGFSAKAGEVIDPTRDNFGTAIRRAMKAEATDFTAWLLARTAVYLKDVHHNAGLQLSKATLSAIEAQVGKDAALSALQWA